MMVTFLLIFLFYWWFSRFDDDLFLILFRTGLTYLFWLGFQEWIWPVVQLWIITSIKDLLSVLVL